MSASYLSDHVVKLYEDYEPSLSPLEDPPIEDLVDEKWLQNTIRITQLKETDCIIPRYIEDPTIDNLKAFVVATFNDTGLPPLSRQEASTIAFVIDRMHIVNLIYYIAKLTNLDFYICFHAIRLFDIFKSKTASIRHNYIDAAIAVVCTFISGKLYGSDTLTHYAAGAINPISKNCVRAEFCFKLLSRVLKGTVKNYEEFAKYYESLERWILVTLEFDLVMPTPIEYLVECCDWFNEVHNVGETLKKEEKKQYIESVQTITDRTIFLCALFMYSHESMDFTAKDIAYCISYLACKTVCDYEPQLDGHESSPPPSSSDKMEVEKPTLRDMLVSPLMDGEWSTTSWSSYMKLLRILQNTGYIVYHTKFNVPHMMDRYFPHMRKDWEKIETVLD